MNEFGGNLSGEGCRFGLVAARFNGLIVNQLLEGARDCLLRHGVREDDLDVVRVPGAWELPVAASRLVQRGGYDALVALGCVIRGETPHFDYVAGEAARGLGALARESGVPIALGVLTTDTVEQAVDRAGTKAGNKGWEASLSALEMATLFRSLG